MWKKLISVEEQTLLVFQNTFKNDGEGRYIKKKKKSKKEISILHYCGRNSQHLGQPAQSSQF